MSNRKVILKMVMSLDGFATSPDGTHEWMFEWFGEDSMERNLRALEEAGVHAMGRRSYDIMGPHWAASEGPIENDGLHWPRHDGLKWPHSRRLLLALMFPHCPVGLQHWRPGRAVVEMFYQRACSSTGDRRGHTVSFVP